MDNPAANRVVLIDCINRQSLPVMKINQKNIAAMRFYKMKSTLFLVVISLFVMNATVSAFPPAPHHLFYGMVRDEFGSPINAPTAGVILEASSGKQIRTQIIAGLEPGVNYRLAVPMDAGLTTDLYKATAMRPTMPFQIKVVINGVTNLPIELKGRFAAMGLPSRRTLMDLTLGQDTDEDGLPDAWERMINPDITKVKSGDDSDKDGLSNSQEYLAGTYAFDAQDGFTLTITGLNEGRPKMKFLAISGRTYTLLGSEDLENWTTKTFRIPSEGAAASTRSSFQAGEVVPIELEASVETTESVSKFYKLLVQ